MTPARPDVSIVLTPAVALLVFGVGLVAVDWWRGKRVVREAMQILATAEQPRQRGRSAQKGWEDPSRPWTALS